jgi:hypothetical protein
MRNCHDEGRYRLDGAADYYDHQEANSDEVTTAPGSTTYDGPASESYTRRPSHYLLVYKQPADHKTWLGWSGSSASPVLSETVTAREKNPR